MKPEGKQTIYDNGQGTILLIKLEIIAPIQLLQRQESSGCGDISIEETT